MVKAGALYFAIVIAFVIAVFSASIIMLAAHYRNSYLKEVRYSRLTTNMAAALNYCLANTAVVNDEESIDLYGDQTDSCYIEHVQWGIYELVTLSVPIMQDTLKKAYLMGYKTDSTALYLSDEDRPLSLSGNTKITGNVAVPKSGIKKTYVDGKAYLNDKLIYNGASLFSNRKLQKLDSLWLQAILINLEPQKEPLLVQLEGQHEVSFFSATQKVRLPKLAHLDHQNWSGNIILFSDSVVYIAANTQLNGVQIYAPCIKVAANFKGKCQLFARDSIIIGNEVNFEYPSVAAVIRTPKSGSQPQLKIGSHAQFNGVLISYESKRSALQTLISIGEKTVVNGEVYAVGLLELAKNVNLNGSVACNTFLMKTSTTLYENFLIDIAINRLARSHYYLSAKLFDRNKERKVLQWLQ